jgi:integrase
VTVDKIRWLLAKAYPLIGTIPIAQITPHEALAVLRKVEATGAYESARRMRSVLSRVFRYGVATVRCDKDVAADLRGAIAVPKVKHFAAITRPSEAHAGTGSLDLGGEGERKSDRAADEQMRARSRTHLLATAHFPEPCLDLLPRLVRDPGSPSPVR